MSHNYLRPYRAGVSFTFSALLSRMLESSCCINCWWSLLLIVRRTRYSLLVLDMSKQSMLLDRGCILQADTLWAKHARNHLTTEFNCGYGIQFKTPLCLLPFQSCLGTCAVVKGRVYIPGIDLIFSPSWSVGNPAATVPVSAEIFLGSTETWEEDYH